MQLHSTETYTLATDAPSNSLNVSTSISDFLKMPPAPHRQNTPPPFHKNCLLYTVQTGNVWYIVLCSIVIWFVVYLI